MLIAFTLVMISFLYIKSNLLNHEVSMCWHFCSHLNTFIYRCYYKYLRDPKSVLRNRKEKVVRVHLDKMKLWLEVVSVEKGVQ